MTTEPERTSDDPRTTAGPLLLVVLAGGLYLTDRAFDGTAQTVVRIVLLVALVGASAWCGSLFRTRGAASGRRS